jgi:hypothetical protein
MKFLSVVSANVMVAATAVTMVTGSILETKPQASTHQIAIAYGTPYGTPKNPAHNSLHDLLVEARVLEQVQDILNSFRLPKRLPISIEGCDGDPDARYVYAESRIKVCYEYIADIWRDAPKETTARGVTPIDAIVGPLADVFFHEFGHALIDLHRIPVLGREEQAADLVSTMLMLFLAKDEARRLILGAAYWYTDDLETAVTLKPAEFSSVHNTPHQRYFNLLCLAYGANQEMFGDLVEKGFLPEERAEDCKGEFQQAAHAFNVLIRPHLDQRLASHVFGKRWMPDVTMRPPQLVKHGDSTPEDPLPSTN